MPAVVERIARALRRVLNRSEWAIRTLGLPRMEEAPTAPGLIMIQIDGLSHTQVQHALAAGRMPFLRSLLDREDYVLHRLYSGQPSSTPAVQGELFYGVRTVVPAFSFLRRQTGEVVRMFEPAAALAVEDTLQAQGTVPLLQGGSAYFDFYGGGAAETHFCPAAVGWAPLLRAANPFALLFLLCAHAYSFVRVLVLLMLEAGLAVWDCVGGMLSGHNVAKELTFVPSRVVLCILLRELVTIGTKIDIARGLPIIHLNFIGYDEHAHRRGPSSRFAHWTLKGIDDAIVRIARAARRAPRRRYTLWIYSDHGQEATLPYPALHGRTIQEAVAEICAGKSATGYAATGTDGRGVESQRIHFLGGHRLRRWLRARRLNRHPPHDAPCIVTAMGPIGMVYQNHSTPPPNPQSVARDLVTSADIPLVLARDRPGRVRAWTRTGEYVLPEDRAQVLGADHPYLDEVAHDLIALCEHPDAGELVICGWRAGAPPVSFPVENGAHAGPGSEETNAFAVLPGETARENQAYNYMRMSELRRSAFGVLGRSEQPDPPDPTQAECENTTLRVMTYNVHTCRGMDGHLSPERIAEVIAEYTPDVVALQELDVGRPRTGGVDQAHLIAQHLEMDFHFHPAIHLEEERYGDAILTHLPMRLVHAGVLPPHQRNRTMEPRGALWVAIDVRGTEVQMFNTHLGLRPLERWAQARALTGRDWLAHPQCRSPIVFCGDLNALPLSPVCLRLRRAHLRDAQVELEGHRPRKTWFTHYPIARIDHVFVDRDTEVIRVEVPSTPLTRTASDHLPLIADLRLPVRN